MINPLIQVSLMKNSIIPVRLMRKMIVKSSSAISTKVKTTFDLKSRISTF
jgi:hypothetical protein